MGLNTRRGDLDHLSAEQLYKNNRLCSNHFEMSQFMEQTKKNKLVWNAVPTLFNVPHPKSLQITCQTVRQEQFIFLKEQRYLAVLKAGNYNIPKFDFNIEKKKTFLIL